MGAAGTGAAPGTASNLAPTHWQTGQAATTIPRSVTAPVAHVVVEYADPALHPQILRLEPDLLIQQLPQLSSAPPMAGKCATIRNSHKHTPRPAAKA